MTAGLKVGGHAQIFCHLATNPLISPRLLLDIELQLGCSSMLLDVGLQAVRDP